MAGSQGFMKTGMLLRWGEASSSRKPLSSLVLKGPGKECCCWSLERWFPSRDSSLKEHLRCQNCGQGGVGGLRDSNQPCLLSATRLEAKGKGPWVLKLTEASSLAAWRKKGWEWLWGTPGVEKPAQATSWTGTQCPGS